MRRGLLAFVCAALLSLLAPAFAQSAPAPKLKVVTTTAMLADAVRAIGGDRVAVESLMGEGVDPHLYKPTRADTAKLLGSDLVIANGLGLEGQFKETFAQLGRTKPVVLAAERVPRERLLADEAFKDRFDPHLWMDPALWAEVCAVLRDALSERDPAGREAYRAGHEAYAAELARLAEYAGRVLASVPAERRVLVTAHDAFGYFARAYGFEVVGIQGVSTESEAGLKRIEEVVALVVARKIPAIFVEASVSDRNVKAVVEGAGKRGHTVAVGPELFSDSMGAPGTHEGTYLGMIDHNVTAIARALGGEAPARGLAGRLAAR
ncbi:MAG TPA: zinc ABC transporter substrate-binding protein [Beijerinckiaceae bacterium]|nr:zinc ABC transporter substrate-binding protein [Beijerinckiaceae bacterium]